MTPDIVTVLFSDHAKLFDGNLPSGRIPNSAWRWLSKSFIIDFGWNCIKDWAFCFVWGISTLCLEVKINIFFKSMFGDYYQWHICPNLPIARLRHSLQRAQVDGATGSTADGPATHRRSGGSIDSGPISPGWAGELCGFRGAKAKATCALHSVSTCSLVRAISWLV